ncbi:MAG: hypothetical protein AABX33_04025 [Nanoarchaeota archaeon]
MITKIKSSDWKNIKIKETNEMKTGQGDISWVYEFLGWGRNAKRT